MGGAAGHMLHPYEALNKDEFISFFKELLSGKLTATEKVDGYNLFVGLVDGKLAACRNLKEKPFFDIKEKFNINHLAYNGFSAGFEALKKLETLSDSELDFLNLKNNFVNLEIIYSEQPNVIKYCKYKNYIVFHEYVGRPENKWTKPDRDDLSLKNLAIRLKETDVDSIVVKYIWENDDIFSLDRALTNEKTKWIFKGPIEISLDYIDCRLEMYHEFYSLIESKNEENQKELMKILTKKIGEKILRNIKSELSETRELDYPNIEGLVVSYKDKIIKITGDFYEYLKDEPDYLKSIREIVQKHILGMNVITMDLLKDKNTLSAIDFVFSRRNKKFNYELYTELQQENINRLISTLYSAQDLALDHEFGKKDILYFQIYTINRFLKILDSIKTYRDLIVNYCNIMYDMK